MKILRFAIFMVVFFIWLFAMGIVVASDADTYISAEIQAVCKKYGEEYAICPELLMAIIERESSGRSDVVSSAGCIGLMQINPKYHAERMERLGVTDLTDIDGNIHVGTDYLLELFKEHGDLYMVLMTYNMGEARARELCEQGKYSSYAVSIVERSAELEGLHGK